MGVRNLPIISTTFEGLTVSRYTTIKNIALNTHEFIFGNSGKMPISYVVAAVRGMQMRGPTQAMATVATSLEAPPPILERQAVIVPSPLITDMTVIRARPASARIKQIKPTNQSLPAVMPK